ncbi:MAG: hypothetical protein ACXW5U_13580 [Thermoanaerobaculia bacterium]
MRAEADVYGEGEVPAGVVVMRHGENAEVLLREIDANPSRLDRLP